MIRGLGLAVGIFILFFAMGFVILQLTTRDPDFLAQKIKDDASKSAPASPNASSGGLTDPEALGSAPAANASKTAPADGVSASADTGQEGVDKIRIAQDDARQKLQHWLGGVLTGGLISALAWLSYAWWLFNQGAAAGIHGMRRAAPSWWLGFLLLVALGVLASLFSLLTEGLKPLISASTVNFMALFCAAWSILAYYLSCAFGAPVGLRPSVPLATSIVPHRSTAV
jgi:hypothetical protein